MTHHTLESKLMKVARIQTHAFADRIASHMPEHDLDTAYLGYRLSYPSRSQIGRAVARGVIWDRPLRDIVRKLGPGELVCDIGANLGASLLTMCNERSDLRFLCFEASPRYIVYLRRNVKRNNLDPRVEIHHTLVGPNFRRWRLSSDVTTGSVARVNPLRGRLVSEQELVSRSLDTWFVQRPPPALMKIDTDGFDLKVLQSGTEVLRKKKPHLFLEFCPTLLSELGNSSEELITFLLDLGYSSADVFAPNGEALQRSVPLSRVATGSYSFVDLHIAGAT